MVTKCNLRIPAELAIFSGEKSDVTALAPVDTFKVEVAARLYRPAYTPDFSHVGSTAFYSLNTRQPFSLFVLLNIHIFIECSNKFGVTGIE
jgi:hypothetical protein